MRETKSTIRFSAKLLPPEATEKIESCALLTLPKTASAKLPSRTATMVEGTINGFPFRATLHPTNNGTHEFEINKALHNATGAGAGDTVTVEITRLSDEEELRVPVDLSKALTTAPRAQKLWTEITPMARRDWILWITSAKQPDTRQIRIKKACSMLASGKRRVCCFGGLNWLTKDHPSVPTWLWLAPRAP